MTASSPRPPRRRRYFWRDLRLRFYAGEVARELNYAVDIGDRAHDLIEDRVTRIEEIIAAGWPRSMVLRRQLRRELRDVDAAYAEAEETFRRRRQQWAGDEVILSSLRAARHRGDPPR